VQENFVNFDVGLEGKPFVYPTRAILSTNFQPITSVQKKKEDIIYYYNLLFLEEKVVFRRVSGPSKACLLEGQREFEVGPKHYLHTFHPKFGDA